MSWSRAARRYLGDEDADQDPIERDVHGLVQQASDAAGQGVAARRAGLDGHVEELPLGRHHQLSAVHEHRRVPDRQRLEPDVVS